MDHVAEDDVCGSRDADVKINVDDAEIGNCIDKVWREVFTKTGKSNIVQFSEGNDIGNQCKLLFFDNQWIENVNIGNDTLAHITIELTGV